MRWLVLAVGTTVAAAAVIAANSIANSAAEPPIASKAALAKVTNDPCARLKLRYLPAGACTHGPDAARPGWKTTDQPALPPGVAGARATCDGDGTSGKRVQVMYVHASDKTDRFSSVQSQIASLAAGVDGIYQASAAETGGTAVAPIRHTTPTATR